MDYMDKIREARKLHKESQKKMAELLKTTQQQYCKYENKEQELPIRHLITLCEHFKLSADEVLGLSTAGTTPNEPSQEAIEEALVKYFRDYMEKTKATAEDAR